MYDEHEEREEIEREVENENDGECSCCRGCFDCLDMSWRDFM